MLFADQPDNYSPRFRVTSCFVECNGKVLFLHRQDNKPQGNTWGVPAGKIDGDEDIATATAREIFEETGLTISPDQIAEQKRVYVRFPDYDFDYFMHRVVLDTEPRILLSSDEHKAFTWKTPQEAVANLPLMLDEDACLALYYNTSAC